MDKGTCRSTGIGVNSVVMNLVNIRQWMIDTNQKKVPVQSVKTLGILFCGWVLLQLSLLDLVFMRMITRKRKESN